MKIILVLASFLVYAAAVALEKPPYILSLHLIRDLPRGHLGKAEIRVWNPRVRVEGLNVERVPFFSDFDFKSFDLTNHTFSVSAQAAFRLATNFHKGPPTQYASGNEGYELEGPDIPFVLFARGEPVYLGVFTSMLSSSSHRLIPRLIRDPDPETYVLKSSTTNDIKFMVLMDTINPKLLSQTNFWNVISGTNILVEPFGTNDLVDVRDDKRIIAAVEKLGLPATSSNANR